LDELLQQSLGTFGPLSVESGRLRLRKGRHDGFKVGGSFATGPEGDGVDLLNEDVLVAFGGFTQVIPAGSFKRRGDEDDDEARFEFKGRSGGIRRMEVEVEEDGEIDFRLKAKGLELAGIPSPGLVPFSLRIGNDLGLTRIRFDEQGRKSSLASSPESEDKEANEH